MSNGSAPVDGVLTPSRAEIEALCLKTARAAGLEWGLAEDAGRSVAVLERAGLPGLDWFLAWLESPAGTAVDLGNPAATALCPIRSGAVLIDHGQRLCLPLSLPDMIVPGLLIGFLLRHPAGFEMAWSGGKARIGTTRATFEGLPLPLRGSVALHHAIVTPGSLGHAPRRPCPIAVWQDLNRLALAITVPATAVSRTGAGAGTHDND